MVHNSGSYLGHLQQLKTVREYNNSYHCFIGKKPIHADYSALFGEIEANHKAPKFKAGDE